MPHPGLLSMFIAALIHIRDIHPGKDWFLPLVSGSGSVQISEWLLHFNFFAMENMISPTNPDIAQDRVSNLSVTISPKSGM